MLAAPLPTRVCVRATETERERGWLDTDHDRAAMATTSFSWHPIKSPINMDSMSRTSSSLVPSQSLIHRSLSLVSRRKTVLRFMLDDAQLAKIKASELQVHLRCHLGSQTDSQFLDGSVLGTRAACSLSVDQRRVPASLLTMHGVVSQQSIAAHRVQEATNEAVRIGSVRRVSADQHLAPHRSRRELDCDHQADARHCSRIAGGTTVSRHSTSQEPSWCRTHARLFVSLLNYAAVLVDSWPSWCQNVTQCTTRTRTTRLKKCAVDSVCCAP